MTPTFRNVLLTLTTFCVAGLIQPALAVDCSLVTEDSEISNLPVDLLPLSVGSKSGWVLPLDQLKPLRGDEESQKIVGLINQTLSSAGKSFAFVMPPPRVLEIPTEVIVEAEQYLNFSPDTLTSMRENYDSLVNGFSSYGVVTPNLAEWFASTPNTFFKADHHWTVDGSYLAAEATWDELWSAGVRRFPNSNNILFAPTGTETSVNEGSYGKLLRDFCDQNIPMEEYIYPTVDVISSPDEDTTAEDLLFGDVELDQFGVLLLGTSYSAPSSNLQFEQALSMWLQADVVNIAIGGGQLTSSSEVLISDSSLLEKADLVIWEAPPSNFQTDAHEFRQVAASLISYCHNPAEVDLGLILPTGEKSDWIGLPDKTTVVQLHIPDISAGIVRIHTEYEDATSNYFDILKMGRVQASENSPYWRTFIGNLTEDGTITTPARIKVEIMNSSEDHTVGVYGCKLLDEE